MTVKELKELLEQFDEEKELILFAENNNVIHWAHQLDLLSVSENGDMVQLFMFYEREDKKIEN